MKKENFSMKMKKIFSVALAAALAAPISMSANMIPVAAAETVTGPEPVASYDFEADIDGILAEDENAEVANSEKVYITKDASALAAGEKLDANGLVYTGEGADAKYVTEEVVGEPTVIEDAERGKVLQFDDKTLSVDKYRKRASASIENDDAATTALDYQIPLYDYYFIKAQEGSNAVDTQDVAAELKVSNPFAGLGEDFKEYDELDDVETHRVDGKYVPLWTKGVTLTYWIKVPVDEAGVYQNASVLRWENDDEYLLQCDDYAKHLTCKKYDLNYANMTDEQKEDALTRSPSGVYFYGKGEDGKYQDPDGLMDYYFMYAENHYTRDEEGHYSPIMYTNADGVEGPVYDNALMQELIHSGEGQFDGTGRFYFSNPRYQKGFQGNSDGTIVEDPLDDAFHNAGFDTVPTIKTVTGASVVPESSYIRLSEGESIDPGTSMVRYALVNGELQIDADDSIFWVSDDVQGINENPNRTDSLMQQAGMQNGDVFFMNSWREGTIMDQYKSGYTYASAKYHALSPVSKVEEGNVDPDSGLDPTAFATPNKNANQWHQVSIILQNDWVEFYVDGVKVDIQEGYSSRGGITLDTDKSFKRLNKGAGMRNGAGSEKDMGNIFYGNYVCRLLMDWLTDENAELCIGGIGNYAKKYAQAMTTSKVCMDDVNFYAEILTEEQIKAIYEGTYNKEQTLPGDADGSGAVNLDDAKLVLEVALGIKEQDVLASVEAADVNGDDKIDLEDAKQILEIALGIEK